MVDTRLTIMEIIAYIFAIPGLVVILFLLMTLISCLLDAKADRDYKRELKEAKKHVWKDHCNWWIK